MLLNFVGYVEYYVFYEKNNNWGSLNKPIHHSPQIAHGSPQ